MIKNSFQEPSIDAGTSDMVSAPLLMSFRNGFLIVFLNPKIAAFFLAIFSQFLNAASNLQSKFILVATATVVDGLWYILLTFVIAVPKFTYFVKISEKKIEFSLGFLLFIFSIVLGIKMIIMFF